MRLFRILSPVLLPIAAALMAAPAWADEIQKAENAGMPQMDVTFFPSQIFWLVVTFAILYVLMKRFALPGVESTQRKRHAVIAAELAAAKATNEDAKKTIAEYEKILADARAEAQAAVIDITTKAAKKSMERQMEQQQVLNKRLHEAEAKIAEARDAALRDAQSAVSEIANIAIEKVTGLKIQVKV